jgi:hypothetical protein
VAAVPRCYPSHRLRQCRGGGCDERPATVLYVPPAAAGPYMREAAGGVSAPPPLGLRADALAVALHFDAISPKYLAELL